VSSGHGVLELNMDEERVNINSEACYISHLSNGLLSPLRLPRRKLASEMPDGPPSGNPMKQKREFLDPEHIPSFYLIQLPILICNKMSRMMIRMRGGWSEVTDLSSDTLTRKDLKISMSQGWLLTMGKCATTI
jgi:hypothetical protein